MANALIAAHIAFHRNVPMLVHILFWYFRVPALLPQAVADWLNSHGSEFILSCVAIGLVMSAYVCEDLRSAVRAIPPGQVEAARALGLGYLQTMRKVVLPQAFRIALPPLLNQTLLLVKNTSLAMAIGVTELTAAGREIENGTFRTFEAYAVVTAIYLALSFLIMGGARRCSVAIVRWGRADHVGHPERQLAAAVDRAISARAAGRAGRDAGPGGHQPGPGAALRRAAGAGAHQSVALLALAGDRRGAAGARPAAIDVHFLGVFLRADRHRPTGGRHHHHGGGAGLL